MPTPYEPFEDKIHSLLSYAQGVEKVTLSEIIGILGHASNYVIILFLATPFLQPIPLFGLSTICGLVIVWSSLLLIAKKPIFLPKYFKRRVMKATTVRKACTALLKLFERTKGWFHKRGRFMSRHILMRSLNGILMCLLGAVLALPLPIPFTNTLPALSLAILCLGSLKEDGLMIAGGWLLSLLTAIYFVTVITLPLHFALE